MSLFSHTQMKDRYGYTYAQRIEEQKTQLLLWGKLLQPEVYASTLNCLEALNAPALSTEGRHGVPLGGELHNLIAAYPRHEQIIEQALMGELRTNA